MGAVLAPTDPAILIPLFVRSRLRPKVAQTVIAESAFNDPTGAALALTLAGVLLSGERLASRTRSRDFLVDLLISTVIGIVAGDRSSPRRSRATARASGASARRSPC